MRKSNKMHLSLVLAGTLFAFGAVASTTNIKQSETSLQLNERYQDLVKQCQYNPDECTFNALGAGNGGGNEPPYTPRKPKKKAKSPSPEQ